MGGGGTACIGTECRLGVSSLKIFPFPPSTSLLSDFFAVYFSHCFLAISLHPERETKPD